MNIPRSLFCLILLSPVFWATTCVPLEQTTGTAGSTSGSTQANTNATLRFEDAIYDPSIRSVQCYAQSGNPEEVFNAPVIPLSQPEPILLEFDQLNAGQQRFTLKVIYCNADWTEARLTQIQYLEDFNEFFITDGLRWAL